MSNDNHVDWAYRPASSANIDIMDGVGKYIGSCNREDGKYTALEKFEADQGQKPCFIFWKLTRNQHIQFTCGWGDPQSGEVLILRDDDTCRLCYEPHFDIEKISAWDTFGNYTEAPAGMFQFMLDDVGWPLT